MATIMHVGFPVKDFDQWKKAYDASIDHRKASGELSYAVYRHTDNPNLVTVAAECRDVEEALAFLNSPEMKAKMEEAGVEKVGPFLVMEEVERGTH